MDIAKDTMNGLNLSSDAIYRAKKHALMGIEVNIQDSKKKNVTHTWTVKDDEMDINLEPWDNT